ncbi:hypothetical protein JG687_00018475, partial [Phytophthora cactorum]
MVDHQPQQFVFEQGGLYLAFKTPIFATKLREIELLGGMWLDYRLRRPKRDQCFLGCCRTSQSVTSLLTIVSAAKTNSSGRGHCKKLEQVGVILMWVVSNYN